MGKMAVGMEREEAFGVLGESSSHAGQPLDRVESGLALQILNLDESRRLMVRGGLGCCQSRRMLSEF
ncbi:MAG: hypothetical protein IPO97_00525 [Sphingomonadales bacterium]|nr:hypothetical protein [Sphingomonadales bacterium]